MSGKGAGKCWQLILWLAAGWLERQSSLACSAGLGAVLCLLGTVALPSYPERSWAQPQPLEPRWHLLGRMQQEPGIQDPGYRRACSCRAPRLALAGGFPCAGRRTSVLGQGQARCLWVLHPSHPCSVHLLSLLLCWGHQTSPKGGAVLLPLGPTGTSSTPALTQCSLFIFPTNDPAFEIKYNKSDVNSALQSPESALLLKTRQPRERFQEKERALVGEAGTPPGAGEEGGVVPLQHWVAGHCGPSVHLLFREPRPISEGIAGIPTSVGTATPSAAVWLCCPLLMGRRTPNPNNCRAERWSWGPRWQLSPPGLVSVLGRGVTSSKLICHHFPKHLPLSIPWPPPRHPRPAPPTSSVCLAFLCPPHHHHTYTLPV